MKAPDLTPFAASEATGRADASLVDESRMGQRVFGSLRARRANFLGSAWSRVALGFCAAWIAIHVAFYVRLIQPNDTLFFEHWHVKGFFVWQLAGFLAIAILLAIARPAAAGRAILVFLALSTVVLLGISRDPVRILGLPALLVWSLCAANTMRLALRRWVGEEFATWAVAAGCIYAALIPICFLLGLAHCLRFWPVAATAALLALPGAVQLRGQWPSLRRTMTEGLGRLDIVEIAMLEALWVLLALAMVNASVDEVWSDAVRVHLPYAHHTAMDQGLSHQYACLYRLQAMAVQTCFAALYILGSDLLVKWACWLSAVSLALLVFEEVRRRGGSRGLGLFGAAAMLGCPILMWLATTAYIDQIMTLLCTTALAVLLRALRPPSLRGILCSALLMSSAAQAKYTGLIFGVAWGLMLAGGLLRQMPWRKAVRWCLAGGSLAALGALPWYVWVYLGTGNPFYPFFDRWFHSPCWSSQLDLLQSINGTFHFRPGIVSRLALPWTATFHTNQFVEGYNGSLGFWVLALLPCLPLAWRRDRSGWDTALGGALMIGGVMCFTPYARYWLPGYPLLMVGLVLALGTVVRRGIGEVGQAARAVLAPALLFLLLLPLPFWISGDSWVAYRRPQKTDRWLAWRLPGYFAITDLNRILKPDEGVLCSGYEGIHKVQGRGYEYYRGWDSARGVRDRATFDDYCRRHRIRYWVVDRGNGPMVADFAYLDPTRHYWTPDRVVAAHGTLVVYDLQHSRPCPWRQVALKEIPVSITDIGPSLLPDSVRALPGWAGDASSRLEGREVVVSPSARIRHAFIPPQGATRCEVQLDLGSAATSRTIAEIAWVDARGKVFQTVPGFLAAREKEFHSGFFATVPPEATSAFFSLIPLGAEPLRLRRAVMRFSTDQPTTSQVPTSHLAEALP